MKPQLLPIVQPIFDLVKGTSSRLVLLKNNTIITLNDNENYKDKLEAFSKLSSDKLISPMIHFYRNYNTLMFINPELEDVGLLYIMHKSEAVDKNAIKKLALENFQKDLNDCVAIFDSATDNFTDYQPVMYLFVNNDIKMGKGKTAGQVGHGVGIIVEELVNNPDQEFIDWKETSMKKIVLKATEKQLNELIKGKEETKSLLKSNCVQVRDAGLTQIAGNSLTVIGFRPMYKKDVPKEFADFSLL